MTKKNGFTLVELAIALMVIGLLIGGILKGQELIDNARTISAIKQISDLHTATLETLHEFYPTSRFADTFFLAAAIPENAMPFSGNVFFFKSSTIDASSIKAKAAMAIDTKLDDGKPLSGRIVTAINGISITDQCITTTTDNDTVYAVSSNPGGCHLIIFMGN